MFAGIEIIQKFSVPLGIDAHLPRIFIVKSPSDVVMTAQVVDPCTAMRQPLPVVYGVLQQFHLPCCQGFPEQGHQQGVVGQLTLFRVNVLDHVIGMNNGFGFEKHRRGNDPDHGVKGPNKGMGFRLVLASGAQSLPDKCHGIQA